VQITPSNTRVHTFYSITLNNNSHNVGRQNKHCDSHTWKSYVQFSSSLLSSQSMSPSHCHARRMQLLSPHVNSWLVHGLVTPRVWLTCPGQPISSLWSAQSTSPSQRHRDGIHFESFLQVNCVARHVTGSANGSHHCVNHIFAMAIHCHVILLPVDQWTHYCLQ